MKFRNVQEVAKWRLCVGCGACAFACPDGKVRLVDIQDVGIRPFIDSENCGDCVECLRVCPGLNITHDQIGEALQLMSLRSGWGPVLEIWEGYATDPQIRYYGSSGGATSAIALFCLEKKGMGGVLHTGIDTEKPYRNRTVFSMDRSGILRGTGSRYSPASPCDGLKRIASADRPCVFIGKPCDIVGLRKAQSLKRELDIQVGISLGIFCAGTPSTMGTLDFIRQLNLEPDKIREIRYRGMGWPGMTTIQLGNIETPAHVVPYHESWGFLQRYRPFRCYLCPDGTSEFADISVGDPWYRQVNSGEAGYSLVLGRTPKGLGIIHEAMDAGYVTFERVLPEVLARSQKNLLSKRSAIYGRLLAMKLLGVPTPRLDGFFLFHNWLSLPFGDKARSIFGTVRRIIQRKYYRKMNMVTRSTNGRRAADRKATGVCR